MSNLNEKETANDIPYTRKCCTTGYTEALLKHDASGFRIKIFKEGYKRDTAIFAHVENVCMFVASKIDIIIKR